MYLNILRYEMIKIISQYTAILLKAPSLYLNLFKLIFIIAHLRFNRDIYYYHKSHNHEN